jgi:hypothetical protein
MKGFKMNPMLAFMSMVLIILLFTYTAISKLIEYDKFVFQMGLSPFLPLRTFAPVLGWLVPIVELMIVLALLSQGWRRAGLRATLVLLFIFELYIGVMLLKGGQLPCTCGGVLSIMGWQAHLVFNAFFMLLAFIGLAYRSPEQNGIDHFNNRIFNA